MEKHYTMLVEIPEEFDSIKDFLKELIEKQIENYKLTYLMRNLEFTIEVRGLLSSRSIEQVLKENEELAIDLLKHYLDSANRRKEKLKLQINELIEKSSLPSELLTKFFAWK